MNSHRLLLWSPFLPDECRSRLEVAIDHDVFTFSTLGPDHLKPVLGRIDGSKLRLRKRISYRNSFQTSLTAEIQPEGTGTAIVGTFGMHPFVRIFMGCWFIFAVLIGGTIFLGTLAKFLSGSRSHTDNEWVGLLQPPLMVAFGVGLLSLARYLARNDRQFITDFLMRTLAAENRT